MLCSAPALAEKADSQKSLSIKAEQWIINTKPTITMTLQNAVLLERGTLTIKADQGVVNEASDGKHSAVVTGHPGKQVFFRQKRDGGNDLWVEGVADKVEYDERSEVVRFISKAHIKYLENSRITLEQEGEFLSYDSANDVFMGANSVSGQHVPGAGRGQMTIHPKPEDSKK